MVRWLALAACVGIVFELTCRVEDWVMYRMPILSPYTSVEDLLVRDRDGMHGRTNAQYEKWVMNNLGTRGPNEPLTPQRGTIRVVAVGASETFGLRESPDQEFPRQLEDSLNTRIRSAGCNRVGDGAPRYEVLNAAFAGMTIPTIDQDLRNRIQRLRPAVVVAYVSPSAYLEEQLPVAARPDSTTPSRTPTVARMLHLRAWERLRDQGKALLPEATLSVIRKRIIGNANTGRAAGWQFTSVPPERVAAFDADLRSLVGTIRAVGATPVLVTHGNAFAGRADVDSAKLLAWDRFYPRAAGSTLIAFDSIARAVTLRVAKDSMVAVADAAVSLSRAPREAFADYMHFSDLGAAIVAGTAATGVASAAPIKECSAVP